MKMNRRDFIAKSIVTTAGISTINIPAILTGSSTSNKENKRFAKPSDDVWKVSIFSKNLHWLDYEAMASVVAQMGFDGVDLTVRPEGHVLPERVAEDLPKAVAALKKEGLNVYMITTAILNADAAHTETILKTASAL